MNLKELKDRVIEDIYPLELPPTEIERKLNEEMEYISRELRIPIAHWSNVVPSSDLAFEPPTDIRTTGIRGFYEEDGGLFHPVYTFEEANGLFPDWIDTNFASKLIVHDAMSDNASFIFRGFGDTELLRFKAVMVPNPMETDSDTPFDGEYDEFHEIVAIRTVSEILKTHGRRRQVAGKLEEGTAMLDWGREIEADFNREMKKAFARVWSFDVYNQGGMS